MCKGLMGRVFVYAVYVAGFALTLRPAPVDAQDSANAVVTGDAVVAIVISPSDTVIHLTDAVRFRAVAHTDAGDTVTAELIWSVSAGEIESQDSIGSVGLYRPASVGRHQIVAMADAGRIRDSATVYIVGGLGSYPNEPEGMTVLGEHSFPAGYFGDDAHFGAAANYTASGARWHMRDLSKELHIETNMRSAPMSPPGTMGMAYPAGMLSSGEPASFAFFIPEQRELYVSYHFMMPSNFDNGMWELEPAGVKILGYISYGDDSQQNQGFPLFKPGGLQTGPLAARSDYMGWGDACRDYFGNPNRITLDEWHQFEFYGKLNDMGEANGVLRIWLDGELYSQCDYMSYVTTAYPHGFWQVHFQPVWGGWHEGLRKSQDDYVYLDHIYVSGVGK
jgi:hypothetical protein